MCLPACLLDVGALGKGRACARCAGSLGLAGRGEGESVIRMRVGVGLRARFSILLTQLRFVRSGVCVVILVADGDVVCSVGFWGKLSTLSRSSKFLVGRLTAWIPKP